MNELAQFHINKYITITCIIVTFICIILLVQKRNSSVEPEIIVVRDTIIIRDTVSISKTIVQTKYHYDTIVVNDTVWLRDTPQMYTDSNELYKLDINAVKLYNYTLDIYRSDTVYSVYETNVDRKIEHFGQFVGIGVGVNYGLDPVQGKLVPSVGVSIVYGLGFYIDQ